MILLKILRELLAHECKALESTAISTSLDPPKVCERFVDDVYSIVKCTHLENFLHDINNLHQNIKKVRK